MKASRFFLTRTLTLFLTGSIALPVPAGASPELSRRTLREQQEEPGSPTLQALTAALSNPPLPAQSAIPAAGLEEGLWDLIEKAFGKEGLSFRIMEGESRTVAEKVQSLYALEIDARLHHSSPKVALWLYKQNQQPFSPSEQGQIHSFEFRLVHPRDGKRSLKTRWVSMKQLSQDPPFFIPVVKVLFFPKWRIPAAERQPFLIQVRNVRPDPQVLVEGVRGKLTAPFPPVRFILARLIRDQELSSITVNRRPVVLGRPVEKVLADIQGNLGVKDDEPVLFERHGSRLNITAPSSDSPAAGAEETEVKSREDLAGMPEADAKELAAQAQALGASDVILIPPALLKEETLPPQVKIHLYAHPNVMAGAYTVLPVLLRDVESLQIHELPEDPEKARAIIAEIPRDQLAVIAMEARFKETVEQFFPDPGDHPLTFLMTAGRWEDVLPYQREIAALLAGPVANRRNLVLLLSAGSVVQRELVIGDKKYGAAIFA